MRPGPNWDMAARVVAETELGFTVPELARKHGRSRQVIRTWMARETDGLQEGAEPSRADFAAKCRRERDALKVEAERRRHEWADLAVTSLRSLLGALEAAGRKSGEDFEKGTIEKGRIRELAGAVKIIGELHLGKSVLFGSSDPGASAPISEASGAGRRGASTAH
jgi:predicted transcriptional regulator